jgi:uncharacterized protein (TIGR02271 family)
MASLTELVASRMTPEVMQKLAGLAGISSPDAKRAIDALIPTQVYDLVSMGATEAGVHRLLSLLKKQQGTESFAHVLLAGEAMQSQAKAGDALQLADPKTNEQVLEVVEEELDVATRQVERGRMRIYSKISERAVESQVSLRDETIRVQRWPVSREVSVADPDLFQERSYEMTEVDEEAVVHVRARVIEEVVIGKEVAEKIETIYQTLRRAPD